MHARALHARAIGEASVVLHQTVSIALQCNALHARAIGEASVVLLVARKGSEGNGGIVELPRLLHCIELFLLHCNALHARAIGVEASKQWGNGGRVEEKVPGAFELGFLSSAEECPQHAQHTLRSLYYTHGNTQYVYTCKHTMCIHTDIHRYTHLHIHPHIYLIYRFMC